MTCEVAVMNRRGIALAADSAVTLGEGKKIYHTAEKLFSISPAVPVAIMTFGSSDMMNAPWETIVKIYAQKLGSRRFGTLEEYAKDLFSFIEGETALFPIEDQTDYVKNAVHAVWSGLYRDKLTKALKKAADGKTLAEIIREDHEIWSKYPDLDELGADYGARIVKTYADAIDQVTFGSEDILGKT